MYKALYDLTTLFPHAHILCIGDIMLDKFRYGEVSRLSPEAPVPVLKITHERSMLGGVGNVAANARALGCPTTVLTVIGNDAEGETIQSLLTQQGIQSICHKTNIPTTTKTRLIAQPGNNHLLREDHEKRVQLTAKEKNKLKHLLQTQLIPRCNIILLSDYGKGLLDPELTQFIIQQAKICSKYVLVDPKGTDYSKYTGATLIKPNLKELSEATRQELCANTPKDREQVHAAANEIHQRYNIDNVVVTLGPHGMLAAGNQNCIHIPTTAREVFDVSGAGDTSLATLGAALSYAPSIEKAMQLANIASGLVVAKSGTATVSLQELQQELSDRNASTPIEYKTHSSSQNC